MGKKQRGNFWEDLCVLLSKSSMVIVCEAGLSLGIAAGCLNGVCFILYEVDMRLLILGLLLSQYGEKLHVVQVDSALLLLFLPLLHSCFSDVCVSVIRSGIVCDFTRLSKLLISHLLRTGGVDRIPLISSLCSFRFWVQ